MPYLSGTAVPDISDDNFTCKFLLFEQDVQRLRMLHFRYGFMKGLPV